MNKEKAFECAAKALVEEITHSGDGACAWKSAVIGVIKSRLSSGDVGYGALITEGGRKYYAWAFEAGITISVFIEKTQQSPVHAFCEAGSVGTRLASIHINQEQESPLHEQTRVD